LGLLCILALCFFIEFVKVIVIIPGEFIGFLVIESGRK